MKVPEIGVRGFTPGSRGVCEVSWQSRSHEPVPIVCSRYDASPVSVMRILFFSHTFPPEVSATASRTYSHCKRWVAAGHDVAVVTCAPNHPRGVVFDGYRNRIRQVEYIDGIRVIRIVTFLAQNKGTWRRIANYLSYMVSAVLFGAIGRRPDIVIASSPQFFCGWAGCSYRD